jgi:CheY-like chemotaxis protein
MSHPRANPSPDDPLRVVVVDDDADTRFLLRRALEADSRFAFAGEAADGADAPAAAREHQPDVVLLDLNMPMVDGLRALPAVRAECSPRTSIVIMSVTQAPGGTLEGAGAPFLLKQPDLSGFLDHLHELLSGAATDDTPTASTWRLPAALTSGGLARSHLRALLDDWELTDLLDEVELLTTELVNNAVMHARSDVVLTVRRSVQCLHVSVSDTGEGVPKRPDAGIEATHGRGLMLVEAMSSDWGATVNGAQKVLWFELELDGADSGP